MRNADRIVVMDAGRVVEQGTHEELMCVRWGCGGLVRWGGGGLVRWGYGGLLLQLVCVYQRKFKPNVGHSAWYLSTGSGSQLALLQHMGFVNTVSVLGGTTLSCLMRDLRCMSVLYYTELRCVSLCACRAGDTG